MGLIRMGNANLILIVAVVAALIVAVLIIIVCIILICRKKKKSPDEKYINQRDLEERENTYHRFVVNLYGTSSNPDLHHETRTEVIRPGRGPIFLGDHNFYLKPKVPIAMNLMEDESGSHFSLADDVD
ncbi:hypothetical protein TCAL_03133 [Tigriopus californicus]|uniref:Uncharacterized protein n=2 Tax=Tigriopus californicus TaxID=6832 RepID=A0A553P1S7_TIGCA|nr:hypothetical protein TCAL_03133 [Tigriopus californicus]|eukprot:TCALIF_03133-PA protein Name:"Protein of unknown function" AED:0.77 eAED:0.77 QI:0/0.33/0.25/0.5/1/1/4/0/127